MHFVLRISTLPLAGKRSSREGSPEPLGHVQVCGGRRDHGGVLWAGRRWWVSASVRASESVPLGAWWDPPTFPRWLISVYKAPSITRR